MAANFIQRGENLTIPATTTTTNGEPVFAGLIRGIALHSAPAGMPLDVATTGVWDLAKVAADDVSLGEPLRLALSAAREKAISQAIKCKTHFLEADAVLTTIRG